MSGDLLGALTAIETALVGSLVAIGQPTLDAIIERRQRYLAVRKALQVAVPQAFFSVVGGVGQSIDGVLRAFITACKDLVAAVLSRNPGNIASSAEVTDVPDLSRKTAMVAVNPPTDTADAPDTDAAAVSLEATSDEKAVSSEKQTPKADADEGQSATKDAESASEGAKKG